jgi:2-phospho-L-lactate guanylyltransferase
MLPWILIPVRSLATGKSRLAAVLDDGARRRLNEQLLARAMAAASEFPGIERTAVISDCADASWVATQAGALSLRQTNNELGLSGAVADGVRILRSRGAHGVLVIVADLPFVGGEDLREIAALGMRTRQSIICPDKHGTGTNALYLRELATMAFRFGPESCAAHLRAGAEAGIDIRVHVNPRVACDVDTPGDLQRYSRAMPYAVGRLGPSSASPRDAASVRIV